MKKAFIITLVLAGIFFTLQVRSFRKVEALVQRSGPASIFQELRVLQIANQELNAQIAASEAKFLEINSKIPSQTIDEEINNLRLLGGEDVVKGEGIEITVPIPIKSFWISDLMARLVSAGAEAAAVNDIRLTASTAGFRDIGAGPDGGFLMRKTFLKAPFRFSIIGPRQTLKNVVTQNGGILDRIKNNYPGIKISVEEREQIVIPALGSLAEQVPD